MTLDRVQASRSVVSQHAQRVQQLSAEATSSSKNDIMDRLKDSDARLADIKAQEDQQRGHLAAIRTREESQTADIPSLIQERNDQQCAPAPSRAPWSVMPVRLWSHWHAQHELQPGHGAKPSSLCRSAVWAAPLHSAAAEVPRPQLHHQSCPARGVRSGRLAALRRSCLAQGAGQGGLQQDPGAAGGAPAEVRRLEAGGGRLLRAAAGGPPQTVGAPASALWPAWARLWGATVLPTQASAGARTACDGGAGRQEGACCLAVRMRCQRALVHA